VKGNRCFIFCVILICEPGISHILNSCERDRLEVFDCPSVNERNNVVFWIFPSVPDDLV